MRIKIATICSTIANPQKMALEQQQFLSALGKSLERSISLTSLEDYNCDLKLIFIQTGGTEGLFLEALPKLQEPYYLLTNEKNNSLAAAMEILTYLKNHNLHGEIIHGDLDDMSKRINLLGKVNQAARRLSATRLGVIGEPSDWLISSIPDFKRVKDLFGIDLFSIKMNELKEKFAALNQESEKSIEVDKAMKVYEALKDISKTYQLDGFTLRCFDLLDSLDTTGCLALSKLNDSGLVAGCEGDVMALISMRMVNVLYEKYCFQANPAKIDLKKNDVVFAHCTIPLKMTNNHSLTTHFESGKGVAIKGELKKEKVAVLRISSDLKHYFLSTGTIVENLNRSDLCRTQINVHLDKSAESLLKNPCGNHHIIFYGDDVKLLVDLLDNFGLENIAK